MEQVFDLNLFVRSLTMTTVEWIIRSETTAYAISRKYGQMFPQNFLAPHLTVVGLRYCHDAALGIDLSAASMADNSPFRYPLGHSCVLNVPYTSLALSHALVPVDSLRNSSVELFFYCSFMVPLICQRSSCTFCRFGCKPPLVIRAIAVSPI